MDVRVFISFPFEGIADTWKKSYEENVGEPGFEMEGHMDEPEFHYDGKKGEISITGAVDPGYVSVSFSLKDFMKMHSENIAEILKAVLQEKIDFFDSLSDILGD